MHGLRCSSRMANSGKCNKREKRGCHQNLHAADPSFMPSTFEELMHCYRTDHCTVFQIENNAMGHSTTNSKEWFDYSGDTHGGIMPIGCFQSNRCVPVVPVAPGMACLVSDRMGAACVPHHPSLMTWLC